jgi:hypothetical protein
MFPESALIVELPLSLLRLPRQRSAQPRRSSTGTIDPLQRRYVNKSVAKEAEDRQIWACANDLVEHPDA